MGVSARLVYVRSEDLLEDDAPAPRRGSSGVGRRRQLTGLGILVAGLPLLTLLLTHTDKALSLEGEVLLYLLAVVVIAAVGGLVIAVPAAVAGALLINYFFVAPRHTLDVAHADQAVALAVFVVVAAVVSALVEAGERRARAAEKSREQAETLAALAGTDLDEREALRNVLARARHTFGMETVSLLVHDRDGAGWVEADRSGWAPPASAAAMRFDVPAGTSLRLVGRGPALFAEDQRVLQAFAAAAQTAYDARRLTDRAGQARSLQAVDRQRTALLAAVGHDLRTPLATIKASSSTLRQHNVELDDGEREELLAGVEQSADRLEAIVANLLDASRLEAGAVSVRTEPVSLDEVVAAALIATAGSDRVTVDVPESLPLVAADPGLLERVLVNVLDNALRHSPAGTAIEVRALAGGEHAKLEVIDHGPGVSAAERERLFEPFQRLDDRRDGGVGLGLSVARGFVEAMGGAMVSDQTAGGGLTMRMRLPLAAGRR